MQFGAVILNAAAS